MQKTEKRRKIFCKKSNFVVLGGQNDTIVKYEAQYIQNDGQKNFPAISHDSRGVEHLSRFDVFLATPFFKRL